VSINLTQQEKDEYLSIIGKVFINEMAAGWQDRFDLQTKGYEYLAGEQYTSAEKSYYENQKRPTNVFNMLFEKFNHVLGEYFLGDQKPRVYAKPGGSEQMAAVWEKYLDHVADGNMLDFEIGKAVLAGWINCGVIYPRWSDEREIDGSCVVSRIDEFETIFDSRATDYFLRDAKYLIRSRWLGVDEILEMKKWGQHKSKLKTQLRDYKESRYYEGMQDWQVDNANSQYFSDEKNGLYRVVEFHEIVWEDVEVAVDPVMKTADIITIKDEKRKRLYLESKKLQVIETRERVKKVTEIIPGINFHLDTSYCDVQDGMYDYLFYHPYPYAQYARDFFGMFKNGKGPQDFINDMMNRTLDIVNKSANAGSEVVAEAYENPEVLLQQGANPGYRARKKAQYMGQKTFERHDPAAFPFSTDMLTKEGLEFLDSITGVKANQLGESQTANENASLYAQRVAQAQIKFAVPTFMLKAIKSALYEKIIRNAQANMTGERMLLIQDRDSGKGEQIFLNLKIGDEILNDVRAGEYGIMAGDWARNPLTKAAQFMKKMESVGFVSKLFGELAVEAIDFKWLFADSDMGDVQPFVERLLQTQAKLSNMQQQQGQMGNISAAMELAAAQTELENKQGFPGGGQGGFMPAPDRNRGQKQKELVSHESGS